MPKSPHELSLSEQILPHIILLDLVGFNNFNCNLTKYTEKITVSSISILILTNPQLTFALVRVCTAASTLAKFPLPSEPEITYLPMHLTCLEDPELLVLP